MVNPSLSPTIPALRLPGANAITRLRVYDTVGPDGQRGGTPHVHLMCSEMYFVLAGSGAVEMIDGSGFSRVEMEPHAALVFGPGTIHRLINPDGDLLILVMMANAGLPERGDNVVCFPDEFLSDDARFAEAMKIDGLEAAYRRRDRGVQGFLALKDAFEQSAEIGRAALRRVYEQAAARTAHKRGAWADVVNQGALAQARQSLDQIKSLDAQNIDALFDARHALIHANELTKPGFCGHLNQYPDPATLDLEGTRQ